MKQNNKINLKEIILQQFLSLEKDAKQKKQMIEIMETEDKVIDCLNKNDRQHLSQLFKLYKKDNMQTLEQAIAFTLDFVRSLHN